MVDLSIVILSWNVRDLLRQCLKSVARDRPLSVDHPPLATEIIVVDNASSDGSVEIVRTEFAEARLIVNTTNRGYTGGTTMASPQRQAAT